MQLHYQRKQLLTAVKIAYKVWLWLEVYAPAVGNLQLDEPAEFEHLRCRGTPAIANGKCVLAR